MQGLTRTQPQSHTWVISDFPTLCLSPSQSDRLSTPHPSGCEGLCTHWLWYAWTCSALKVFQARGASFSESCFLWAPNRTHGPTLFCSPLLPKTYQLILGLEREALVRACPRGVKVSREASASGQTGWKEQQPLPEAQWGQWAVARAQQFQDVGSPASADQTHSPWLLQKKQRLLSSIAWNSYTFHVILTWEMAWRLLPEKSDHKSALREAPLKEKCWLISSIIRLISSVTALDSLWKVSQTMYRFL